MAERFAPGCPTIRRQHDKHVSVGLPSRAQGRFYPSHSRQAGHVWVTNTHAYPARTASGGTK